MAIIYDKEASRLLFGKDKECEILFENYVNQYHGLPIAMAREIVGRVRGGWRYVYACNHHKVEYSSAPMIFQKGIVENNNIICFER